MSTVKNPYEPRVYAESSVYTEMHPCPYTNRWMYSSISGSPHQGMNSIERQLDLIKTPHDTLKKVLDAVESIKHSYQHRDVYYFPEAVKAIELSGMSKELRSNESEMLKLLQYHPTAWSYIDKSLQTKEFFAKAVVANPKVYDHLPSKMQKDQDVINAYARGIRENGCWRIDSVASGLYCAVCVFKEPVSSKCDQDILYSVENYRDAYEKMLVDGAIKWGHKGDPRDFEAFPVYTSDVAFVHMAQLSQRNNMDRLNEYQWVQAELLVKHIDRVTEVIRNDPTCDDARYLAEAVAYAASTLEHPPVSLLRNGVVPQPETAKMIIQAVENAEREYWKQQNQKLSNLFERYKDGDLDYYEAIGMEVLVSRFNNHGVKMDVDESEYKRVIEERPTELLKRDHAGVSQNENFEQLSCFDRDGR